MRNRMWTQWSSIIESNLHLHTFRIILRPRPSEIIFPSSAPLAFRIRAEECVQCLSSEGLCRCFDVNELDFMGFLTIIRFFWSLMELFGVKFIG